MKLHEFYKNFAESRKFTTLTTAPDYCINVAKSETKVYK